MLQGNVKVRQFGAVTTLLSVIAVVLGLAWVPAAQALTPVPVGTGVQCPNDIDNSPFNWMQDVDAAPTGWATGGAIGPEDTDHNGDGVFNGGSIGAEDFDWNDDTVLNQADGSAYDTNVVCMRLGGGDGFAKMPDGTDQYLFGFVDLTGVPESEIVNYRLKVQLPAPVIHVAEGQELYITLTNLSLLVRPDLADPHTIHFHGYPHAMAIFDGVPELSLSVPGGSNFTYYYKLNDPGTYPYHCHVEPVEHLEMGMVGTIVVDPAQNGTVVGTPATTSGQYVYNDGGLAPDTSYDVAADIHLHDIDARKHYNLETVQEGTTEWWTYKPHYFTINGRGYPDTILASNDPSMVNTAGTYFQDYNAQPESALVRAVQGERIHLRLMNLSYRDHTVTIPGIPMHVVGEDARILRTNGGVDVSYMKHTYGIAAGKSADVILETANLAKGKYFLYARELNMHGAQTMDEWESTREADCAAMHAPTFAKTCGGAENNNGAITEIWIE